MNRRALVVTHLGREEAVAATEEAVRELERVGFEVVRDADGADLTGVEIAVVLGGDGTILRAAEVTRGTDIPLLGVNLGHVGFLAESEREDIGEAVRRLANRDYEVEERTTLGVSVLVRGQAPILGWALNEATVEKADRARMLEVLIEVDGRPLSTFGCDGVVMASATGSTAHAFSAGGPVVWPDVDAMLLVPISAHALFARPLVVGPPAGGFRRRAQLRRPAFDGSDGRCARRGPAQRCAGAPGPTEPRAVHRPVGQQVLVARRRVAGTSRRTRVG
jgi:NAD+ kinase